MYVGLRVDIVNIHSIVQALEHYNKIRKFRKHENE